ncbi:hypothetical protein M422DRAFT_30825 [Sphaerobolus stellatus SS14]|uniref:Unplaced genomic scaffold SPHSTscaffold_47, whole genome shotgun sequence n=1 Tax=Sphaerobolus stellatus (strain SS14) TaxID=990650 RepID=A0A0C9UKF0_SPHS4|nr:hypothetical protein M422DRAFT_30825 [Sphaerobolus stellatus SS14]
MDLGRRRQTMEVNTPLVTSYGQSRLLIGIGLSSASSTFFGFIRIVGYDPGGRWKTRRKEDHHVDEGSMMPIQGYVERAGSREVDGPLSGRSMWSFCVRETTRL